MSKKGSRIIPQNTWFYADSGLSCPQRTYENIALHYGTCSSAQVNKEVFETQCKTHVSHPVDYSYLLDAEGTTTIPLTFMQMKGYRASNSIDNNELQVTEFTTGSTYGQFQDRGKTIPFLKMSDLY